eukprot:1156988-Pelagomonas_calceolata.AAC.11
MGAAGSWQHSDLYTGGCVWKASKCSERVKKGMIIFMPGQWPAPNLSSLCPSLFAGQCGVGATVVASVIASVACGPKDGSHCKINAFFYTRHRLAPCRYWQAHCAGQHSGACIVHQGMQHWQSNATSCIGLHTR